VTNSPSLGGGGQGVVRVRGLTLPDARWGVYITGPEGRERLARGVRKCSEPRGRAIAAPWASVFNGNGDTL
jgi:hypothetical protein